MIKKIVLLTAFVSILIVTINIFFQEESEYIENSISDICGEYPENYEKPDIENNPNFVFVNDMNFEAKRLLDIEGNVVFVNSFIECEHYVNGGWNFSPNPNFVKKTEIVKINNCNIYQNLRNVIVANDKVYIQDLGFKTFFKDNVFLCMGKISDLNINNNNTEFVVLYSHQAYVFFSQIIPLFFLIFIKLIHKNILIFSIIFYQVFVQFIFNFNFGFNLINSVSLYETLILILFINESENENRKLN